MITIRGGKTVEVLNTDAEGRLVLADGLVAASEEQPDAIIDVATLTGAAIRRARQPLRGSHGRRRRSSPGGRRVANAWAKPSGRCRCPPNCVRLLNSDVADIANAKIGNTAGGMLLAAVFLREFVGTTGEGDEKRAIPWAHLDIAGPGTNPGGGFGFTGKGPTGVSVRALLALAEEFSHA